MKGNDMADNPMKGVIAEMRDQLRTRPLDLDDIRRRQAEVSNAEIGAAEGEPGSPERFNAEA